MQGNSAARARSAARAAATAAAIAATAIRGCAGLRKDELVLAGVDLDEIEQHAFEQLAAGRGDEDGEALALVRKILLALVVEAEAEAELAVVLELGGVIIGAAVLDEHGDVGVLRALSIDPPYRRRRHGTALAAFVIRLAYEHGL
ncbi:GNAT family N-acetyltransferase, partial [Piscinibacter sp.]|uniref:GNAT family N-acetyltransferase n=1 Tax=Piscinibacter sp. TaxID=1903157 RepID=UPI0037852CA1